MMRPTFQLAFAWGAQRSKALDNRMKPRQKINIVNNLETPVQKYRADLSLIKMKWFPARVPEHRDGDGRNILYSRANN